VNGPNPPPPPTLAQAITSILESRDEQTDLLRQLVANSARASNGARNAPASAPTTYGDFTATHPPIFTKAGEPEGRSLVSCDRVQVWASSLHGAAEDSPPCSSYREMLACGGPTTPPLAHRLPSVMGRVLQHFPRTSHPGRCDEKEVSKVHGSKTKRKIRA
jgi:hypothetical protein